MATENTIRLRHVDGTSHDVTALGMTLPLANLLATVLGKKGWALVTTRTAVVEEEIGKEAPAAKPKREEKEPPKPADAVLTSVTALFTDGKGLSKAKVREALQSLPVDVVDGCVDWMRFTGALTLEGKTYKRAVTP